MSGLQQQLCARSGHSPIAPDISGQALQYNATLAKGLLNKQEVEAIHLVVSEVSGCDYCLAAHLPFAYLRYECLKTIFVSDITPEADTYLQV